MYKRQIILNDIIIKAADKSRRLNMNSKCIDYTTLTIIIIGAINWGLIGFFNFNLVAFLFGQATWISRVIYAIVGLCGLYQISVYGRIRDLSD